MSEGMSREQVDRARRLAISEIKDQISDAKHDGERYAAVSLDALDMAIAALSAELMRWHYDDFPPSDPEKRYVVVRTNELFVKPILDTADYYTGDGVYSEKPWHLDGGYSCYPSEILAWADVGEIGEIIKHIGDTE